MALRFQVAGFPVQVHPFFFLMALATGMTGWSSPGRLVVWFCVVFVSVLVHELGHALAFRHYGHEASISLHGLGGTTHGESGRALTHRQDLWVSLAGPVAGFLLGGLVLALNRFTPLGHAGGLVRAAVNGLLWANIGWGLFNLLPILPLDGGHVMAAVIRQRGGTRFEWIIHGISLLTAAAGLVLAIVWREPWLGMFALALGVANLTGFARAWVERGYILKIRAVSRRARPVAERDQASPGVEHFLSELRLPTRFKPPGPQQRPPERSPALPPPPEAPATPRAAPEPPAPRDADFSEPPHDSRFVGEMLLGNGLAELAVSPLRSAFHEAPEAQTGHLLVTALLEAKRHPDLARLLASPSQQHLGAETLSLIAARADTVGQPALGARARELLQARSEPLPARGAHDSEKPG